ncbi:MAG: polysaccharide biosynthesis protein [Clostridia bacterium]|nr:polysaccharide biosynthesis protein [Clostridia bacterium]
MKDSVLKGGLILVVAGVLGKILGAFYRIPLSNILSPEGIGLYQMIFPVFSLALIISAGGVSATVAHAVAKIRASGEGSIKDIFKQGFLYTLILSVFFALIFLIFGDQIATLQGNPLAGAGYKMCAFALIFSSLLASFRGLFQGFQNMVPTAVSQTLEQMFKVVFGLVFAYFFSQTSLGLGVVGAFLGITIAEIISLFYLIFKLKTQKINFFYKKTQKNSFFKTNFIITASFLIIPALTTFDSFAVINLLSQNFTSATSTALYGLQSGMVNSLINFPVVVSVAISLSLLPTLTFFLTQHDQGKASETVGKIFNFLLVLLLPCILIFVFFAEDIFAFIYPSLTPDLLSTASLLLQISSFQILFISILQISTSVFQSLDKPTLPILFMSLAGAVKILSTILLIGIPAINIFGLAISNFLFYAIAGVLSLVFVKKLLPFSLKTKTLAVLIPSLTILCTSFWLVNVYITSFWVKIFCIGFSGLLAYVLPILIFDVFEIKHSLAKTIFKWRAKNE